MSKTAMSYDKILYNVAIYPSLSKEFIKTKY